MRNRLITETKIYHSRIWNYMLILIVVWTVIAVVSLWWNLYHLKQNVLIETRNQARAIYEKDVFYRRWNARHGGVYVPVTDKTQPNPYLNNIPNRDITTISGEVFTLINPAFMTRQVHELMDEEEGSLCGNITSLNPINPINKPDPWEIKALKAFENGETEISSVNKMENGKEYMRLMRPLITEKQCLKCHAVQGYKVGDIRGGISVSIPMEPRLLIVRKQKTAVTFGHGILWFLGLGAIILGGRRQFQSEEQIKKQIEQLSSLHTIDTAITSNFNLQAILNVILENVISQLHVDAAAVLLLNQDTQTLEYVDSIGFRSDALKYTTLKLGESNAGRAAKEQRITTIPNLGEYPDGFARSELFPQENFMTYFGVPLISKGKVTGVLEVFNRALLSAKPEWLNFLETIGDQTAIAIDNATLFNNLKSSNTELTLAYETTIEGWSRAMDFRDKETEGHTQRVSKMTLKIARVIGVKEKELTHIRRGALLHDMGKMGIPDSILLKPGSLTEEEWKIMKLHPEYAYNMLHQIEYLRPALDIPYCHHEKWDGTGYPRGLKGEQIPLAARIFAVIDVWDALSSDRPYRAAWPKEKVLKHIHSLAGSHFDPEVVKVFLKMDL